MTYRSSPSMNRTRVGQQSVSDDAGLLQVQLYSVNAELQAREARPNDPGNPNRIAELKSRAANLQKQIDDLARSITNGTARNTPSRLIFVPGQPLPDRRPLTTAETIAQLRQQARIYRATNDPTLALTADQLDTQANAIEAAANDPQLSIQSFRQQALLLRATNLPMNIATADDLDARANALQAFLDTTQGTPSTATTSPHDSETSSPPTTTADSETSTGTQRKFPIVPVVIAVGVLGTALYLLSRKGGSFSSRSARSVRTRAR